MIKGKQIYLRAMEPEDMDCFWDMINDPEISHNVVGWSAPVSKRAQMQWYERVIGDRSNLRFTIVLKETAQPVGMITLTSIDWQSRCAESGIKLHSACPKGKGIATDAVMTLMGYAFEEMGLHRVESTRITYNKASEKLYNKCGWVVEGRKREAIYRDGRYHDLIVMSVLKADYLNAKERLGW